MALVRFVDFGDDGPRSQLRIVSVFKFIAIVPQVSIAHGGGSLERASCAHSQGSFIFFKDAAMVIGELGPRHFGRIMHCVLMEGAFSGSLILTSLSYFRRYR